MYRTIRKNGSIAYCEIEPSGYYIRIEKFQDGWKTVKEMSGGNSKLDPSDVVPSDSPLRLPVNTIKKRCRHHAKQLLETP